MCCIYTKTQIWTVNASETAVRINVSEIQARCQQMGMFPSLNVMLVLGAEQIGKDKHFCRIIFQHYQTYDASNQGDVFMLHRLLSFNSEEVI